MVDIVSSIIQFLYEARSIIITWVLVTLSVVSILGVQWAAMVELDGRGISLFDIIKGKLYGMILLAGAIIGETMIAVVFRNWMIAFYHQIGLAFSIVLTIIVFLVFVWSNTNYVFLDSKLWPVYLIVGLMILIGVLQYHIYGIPEVQTLEIVEYGFSQNKTNMTMNSTF